MTTTWSAAALAEALGLPTPTEPQQRVIEAPATPALVVAGAGSGKTETMANRIVWLLANGHVEVSQILGLTFTRKAAGELQERVVERIGQLRTLITEIDGDPLDAPTISTYNAFASGLFREYARGIGREPDATVITEASAWQLARRIVMSSTDVRLAALDRSADQIIAAVLRLSRALSDNDALTRTDDLRRLAETFGRLEELPLGNPRKRTAYKSVVDAVRDVRQLPLLLDLAEEFRREKQRRGLIEFSDQIALALQITRAVPRAREHYRDRFRIVILDEYQDTSVVQTDLLAGLFAEHPVMAVGDPNQSIYGWRGASAANIARFAEDFAPQGELHHFSLATSWRNAQSVLVAANAIVAGLPPLAEVPVERLTPAPSAVPGQIEIDMSETHAEEAERIARWFQAELARPSVREQPRTAALLCRSVKRSRIFVEALQRHGVPYHVLGLTGLLEQPAVVDVMCTLRVLHDPTAGSELVRLLTGARWNIGPADIVALHSLARWLGERDIAQKPLDESIRDELRRSTYAEDTRSLIDALDFLGTAPEGHRALESFSELGRARLRQASAQLTGLRRRTSVDLVDLVNIVIHEGRLDIEVAANESDPLGRSSLDAFLDQVESFRTVDDNATLGPFLSWLAEVERRENLSPRSEAAEAGTVQILTIHGAKGLEWDSVAVPRLVEGEMPSSLRSRRAWTAFGELPYEYRGDRGELPVLAWRGAETQMEFDDAYDAFGGDLDVRDEGEQRRLAYVAVTRARDALLLTGSFWAGTRKPRPASRYLHEVRDALGLSEDTIPAESTHEEDPLGDVENTVLWPRDPLGARRARVVAGAEAVRRADDAETPWSEEIAVLLAERAHRLEERRIALPSRVAASRFKDFVLDPVGTARRLARPMPERPYRQTRLGTLFHAWVEQRLGGSGGGDVLDQDIFERDDDDLSGTQLPPSEEDRRALRELQDTFLRSEWGGLSPVEVEREINVIFDGRVLICKLDAVYLREGRHQIVDWKTGRAPRTPTELEERQFQLALYRYAYAEWRGVPIDEIDAVFYYVTDDTVVRPERLDTPEQLRARWRAAVSPEASR